MNTFEKLNTPLSVLEVGKEKAGEFLVSIFGPEQAHQLIDMLAEANEETLQTVVQLYYDQLQSFFPSLPFTLQEYPSALYEHHSKANQTIEYIRTVGFPETRNEMTLLNAVTYSSINAKIRLHRLFSNHSDARFQYELLRQEILMLTSLAYMEAQQSEHVLDNLYILNEGFERDLFLGNYCQTYPYECYSVHDNQTNKTILTSANFDQVPEINYQENHFKQHLFRVRKIPEIGPVLVRQRHKDTQSALIKAIYKGILAEAQSIDLKEVTDTSGFLFVAEEGKDQALLEKVSQTILTLFPEATIVEDHKVGNSRKQSQNVTFLRIQVYLETDSLYPVELIFFTQSNYLDYTYHLGSMQPNKSTDFPDATAHKLYELRRTYTAADILFPQEMYDYNPDTVRATRKHHELEIGNQLLAENFVIKPVAHLPE